MSTHGQDAAAGQAGSIADALPGLAKAIYRDERYFETLFENAPDAVVVLSETSEFLDANPAACQLTGFAKHDLIGRKVAETMETTADFDSAWSKFKREGQYRGQRWLVRADGARRLIEIRAIANVFPGRHLAIWRDVTDRYFLDSALLQRERDEALARLAGGIAHDLTNSLNVIGGHIELMTRQITASPVVQEHIERILAATQHGAALTAQLSALARQQVLSPAVLDLGGFLFSCRGALRSLMPDNVELSLPRGKRSTPIRVDRTQLAQMIFTIASTASEGLPNGGHLDIEVQTATLKLPLASAGFCVPSGDYVVLEFRARARGFDGEGKVCLPSSQLLPPRREVPMVLPAVAATVKQNNGFMYVGDGFREGTAFSIYFPHVVGPGLTQPEAENSARGGMETILLVEGDPALREATREYLSCIGYRVLASGNGKDALKTAHSVGSIDALIADLRMPKIGGRELAEKISAVIPNIKVMFVSGHIDRDFLNQLPEQPRPALLSKPFEMRVLANRLRDLLEGKNR